MATHKAPSAQDGWTSYQQKIEACWCLQLASSAWRIKKRIKKKKRHVFLINPPCPVEVDWIWKLEVWLRQTARVVRVGSMASKRTARHNVPSLYGTLLGKQLAREMALLAGTVRCYSCRPSSPSRNQATVSTYLLPLHSTSHFFAGASIRTSGLPLQHLSRFRGLHVGQLFFLSIPVVADPTKLIWWYPLLHDFSETKNITFSTFSCVNVTYFIIQKCIKQTSYTWHLVSLHMEMMRCSSTQAQFLSSASSSVKPKPLWQACLWTLGSKGWKLKILCNMIKSNPLLDLLACHVNVHNLC